MGRRLIPFVDKGRAALHHLRHLGVALLSGRSRPRRAPSPRRVDASDRLLDPTNLPPRRPTTRHRANRDASNRRRQIRVLHGSLAILGITTWCYKGARARDRWGRRAVSVARMRMCRIDPQELCSYGRARVDDLATRSLGVVDVIVTCAARRRGFDAVRQRVSVRRRVAAHRARASPMSDAFAEHRKACWVGERPVVLWERRLKTRSACT
jgi:hypothetical protein